MSEKVKPAPARPSPKDLQLSEHVATFAHMGAVYVYHDLYGYLMEMSPDILDFLWEFRERVDPHRVCSRYANAFEDQAPEGFVGIFLQFKCLVPPGSDERSELLSMVPVHGRWNVLHRDDDGGLTLYTAWGGREVCRHRLDPEERAIFEAIDGETPVSDLAGAHGEDRVLDLLERLVHHDVQAVKLSATPLSFYKGRRHLEPPYLTSTMPYAPYRPGEDEVPAAPELEAYHRESITDAQAQFDVVETTLSHLLRRPHPALGGQTYGEAVIRSLAVRDLLPDAGIIRVLEVGAGLGFVADSAIAALEGMGLEVHWDIVELSPALAAAQRERLAETVATVHEGDVLEMAWPSEAYDLVLANEMVGDLPAQEISREAARLDDEALEGEAFQAHLRTLGPGGEVAARHILPLGDSPPAFWIQWGAMRLLERASEHLAPGGTCLITEFGDLARFPVLSRHLDHPELSTHFGHLMSVGQSLGLGTEYVFVMDLVELDRDAEGLQTTRSQLQALQALFEDHSLELPKVGWTRDMLAAWCEEKLDLERVGDLRYDAIENRLMGLVPHEFKALLCRHSGEDAAS